MTISLPQHDESPARLMQLEDAQRVYGYVYHWPPEVAVAAVVPKGDSYSAHYVEHLIPVMLKIIENLTLVLTQREELKATTEDAVDSLVILAKEAEQAALLGPEDLHEWIFNVQTSIADAVTQVHLGDVEAFQSLFQAIPTVPVMMDDLWRSDEAFAWQRIAGFNPMTLEQITELPAHIAIAEEHWTRAGLPGTLADTLAAGQVFAADYALLTQAQQGKTDGVQKYIHAPYALFTSVTGPLMPVAIQIGQDATDPVYTPEMGQDWLLAKFSVQVSDANIHETMIHLGRTHMVMEACTLATHRQLATIHPLHVLLIPHCQYTMPINHSAATSLIAPDGVVDRAFACNITNSVGLVKHALETWPLDAASPAQNTAARGLTPDVLPIFPYRDDAIPVWDATHRFVSAYIAHYYVDDNAVKDDTEVQAWVEELQAHDGGRLTGIGTIDTVQSLIQLVTTFIFTGSSQHAAVNFTQFPFMGAIPNVAGALWKNWPQEDAPMVEVMPPMNMALLQFNTVYQLSGIRINFLGKYPNGTFTDPAVLQIVANFHAELHAVEQATVARDSTRFMSYPYLRPSQIPNSIHI